MKKPEVQGTDAHWPKSVAVWLVVAAALIGTAAAITQWVEVWPWFSKYAPAAAMLAFFWGVAYVVHQADISRLRSERENERLADFCAKYIEQNDPLLARLREFERLREELRSTLDAVSSHIVNRKPFINRSLGDYATQIQENEHARWIAFVEAQRIRMESDELMPPDIKRAIINPEKPEMEGRKSADGNATACEYLTAQIVAFRLESGIDEALRLLERRMRELKSRIAH